MTKPRLDPDDALTGPLYVVAALLAVIPAIDFLMSVGAPQPASLQWRFATVGLLSGFMLTPIIGAALALGIAGLARHTTVMRVIVVLCLITSVGLLVLTAGFLLDVLQLRASIPADGQRAFLSASLRAVLKHVLSAGAFWYLGWRARRMIPARTKARTPKTVQIVNK